jgi:hypothetical protein
VGRVRGNRNIFNCGLSIARKMTNAKLAKKDT